MKMNIADKVKAEFEAAICKAIEDWKHDTNEETVHFTKNSKLDRVTMIKMLCLMGGNSLRKELHDYPKVNVTASSFSERRAAIDSELMYYVLRRFSDTDSADEKFLCKGRKLVAIDGVNFNTALNKDALSFMPVPNTAKGGYNQYKATVMMDLLSHQTVDLVLHPISQQNEHADAEFMVLWNDFPPCILKEHSQLHL